ncbi:hypothetical protein [Arachnia propionica]|uniref:hypothetical protein n=1 Tax=Arachnia propionica TaxID=1750 RepID=UPI003C6EFD46
MTNPDPASGPDEVILDHVVRHGIAAPGQPAPRPQLPGDTHTAPRRYDPPCTIKQDPR